MFVCSLIPHQKESQGWNAQFYSRRYLVGFMFWSCNLLRGWRKRKKVQLIRMPQELNKHTKAWRRGFKSSKINTTRLPAKRITLYCFISSFSELHCMVTGWTAKKKRFWPYVALMFEATHRMKKRVWKWQMTEQHKRAVSPEYWTVPENVSFEIGNKDKNCLHICCIHSLKTSYRISSQTFRGGQTFVLNAYTAIRLNNKLSKTS